MAFDKIKYDNEYIKNHYTRVTFKIPKGCIKDIKNVAYDNGITLTQLIISAIEAKYEIKFK